MARTSASRDDREGAFAVHEHRGCGSALVAKTPRRTQRAVRLAVRVAVLATATLLVSGVAAISNPARPSTGALRTVLAQPHAPDRLPDVLQWVVTAPVAPRGQTWQPEGIALTPDGGFVVADTGHDRLQWVDPVGRVHAVWGGHGAEPGHLSAPQGVAIAPAGSPRAGWIYVADSGNHRIAVFDETGRGQPAIGEPGTGIGRLALPADVAIAGDGTVWVADRGNHRLQAFDAEGRWVSIVGERGADPGQLLLPAGVDMAQDGALWVADTGNHRVQRLAPNGAVLVRVGGRRGSNEGQFSGPRGLQATADGGVWITDAGNDRLVHLGPGGTWRAVVDPQGRGDELAGASGIALDADGRLWVALAEQGTVAALDASTAARLTTWGAPAQERAMTRPVSAAHDPDGGWVVADAGESRLHRFDELGRWQSKWGQEGEGPGELQLNAGRPAVAVAPDRRVWVSDPGNHRMQRFQPDGRVNGIWSPQLPAGAGEALPGAIAIGPDGAAVFVDLGAGFVGRFAATGAYERLLGGWGRLAGHFAGADDVAVAQDGSLWVAESANRRVQVLDAEGRSERIHGKPAWDVRCGPVVAPWPRQVVARSDGRMIVHGGWSGRVELWDEDGAVLDEWLGPPLGQADRLAVDRRATGLTVIRGGAGRIERYAAAQPEGWRLEWHDNGDLTGWPVVVRQVDRLAADWGDGAPDVGLPDEGASLRATKRWAGEGGAVRLRIGGRGAARAWLDGELVLDAWMVGTSAADAVPTPGPTEAIAAKAGAALLDVAAVSAPQALAAAGSADLGTVVERRLRPGAHVIVIEYRDAAGAAALSARVDVVDNVPPPATATARPTDVPTPWPTMVIPSTATASPLPPPTAFATPGPWRIHLPIARKDAGREVGLTRTTDFAPNDGIDIEDVSVVLRIPDPGVADIEATARMTLTLRAALEHVDLDVEPDGVQGLRAWSEGEELGQSWLPGPPNPWRLTGSRVRIALPAAGPVSAGSQVVLDLAWTIPASSLTTGLGMAYQANFAGSRVLYTRNAHYYARRWLPTNDHPADPARYDFDLRVPPDFVAAATGTLVAGSRAEGEGLDDEGLRRFRFAAPRALPSYQVALAVGELAVVESEVCWDDGPPSTERADCADAAHRVPFFFYKPANPPGAQAAFVDDIASSAWEATDLVVWHSRAIAPWPHPTIGLAYVPHPFNMEYPGLTTLLSSESIIARHELLHGWWGNDVRIPHWGDFWIKEGLTTYLSAYWDGFTEEPPWCECSPDPLAGAVDVDPNTYIGRSSLGVPAYCKGTAAWHDLNVRIADARDESIWDDGSETAFLLLLHRLHASYAGRSLSSQQLAEFVVDTLPELVGEAADAPAPSVVRDFARAWALRWLDVDPGMDPDAQRATPTRQGIDTDTRAP